MVQQSARVPGRRLGSALVATMSTFAVGMFWLAVFGRGLWELLVPKSAAFVVQAGLFVAGVVLVLATQAPCFRPRNRRAAGAAIVIAAGLALIAAASAILSLSQYDSRVNPAFYLAVTAFAISWWLTTIALPLPPRFATLPVAEGLAMMTVVALIVTGLEVLGIWSPPGSQELRYLGLVRPAGITGAMQHHAILLAGLAFVFWEFAKALRSISFRAISTIVALASITSLTRSGAMVIGVGLCVVFSKRVWTLSQRHRLPRLGLGLPVIVASAGLAWLAWSQILRPTPVPIGAHVERVLSSFDLASVGNSQRVASWERGVQEIGEGPVILGHRTGAVTNVTSRLGGADSYVVESGVLQQILNYGIVGCFLFYVVMGMVVTAIPTDFVWLRGAAIGLILNSFVYQTVEVFPVIVLLGLLPWFADALSIQTRSLERRGLRARLETATR